MPERLIGAVLKTVERSRVPWVRIPPPPYKNGLTLVRPVFILCGVCIEVSVLRRADGAIILGNWLV